MYFNSNEYHGHRFLSNTAARAGYSDSKVSMSDITSIVQKGVASLLVPDTDQLLQSAEDAMLKTLVMSYPSAGNAVKNIMDASSFVGPSMKIEWTNSDKEWLFNCLIDENNFHDLNADNHCNPEKLRELLSCRSDVPEGAFGELDEQFLATSEKLDESRPGPSVDAGDIGHFVEDGIQDRNGQNKPSQNCSRGSLDNYFTPDDLVLEQSNMFLSEIPNNTTRSSDHAKAEVGAQEQLMVLVTASAAKRANEIRDELNTVSVILNQRAEALDGISTEHGASLPLPDYDTISVEVAPRTKDLKSLNETTSLLSVSSLNGVRANSMLSGMRGGNEQTRPSIGVTLNGMDTDNALLSQNDNSTQETLRIGDSNLNLNTAAPVNGRNRDNSQSDIDGVTMYDNMSNEDLTSYCKQLMKNLQDAVERRHSLETATKRVTLRLMRYSSSAQDVEGQLSMRLQKEIASNVDEFTEDVKNGKLKTNDGTGENESEQDEKTTNTLLTGVSDDDGKGSHLEEDLAEIKAEWGEWYEDDYEWTPDQAGQPNTKKHIPHYNMLHENEEENDENDETLEETLARLDEEWKNWCD